MMNNIKLSYKKKTSNKYTFLTEVNGKIIGDRVYTGTPEDHKLFSGFVDYMQERIEEELKQSKDFTFHSLKEFRAWANASVQQDYLDYLDSQL